MLLTCKLDQSLSYSSCSNLFEIHHPARFHCLSAIITALDPGSHATHQTPLVLYAVMASPPVTSNRERFRGPIWSAADLLYLR
jgi:hypothetical protein